MTLPLPCVVMLRPVDPEDPCLIRSSGGYLFPRVLSGLVRAGVFSEAVCSVPSDIPPEMKDILRSWDTGLHVTDKPLPQERLADLFQQKGYERAFVLSGYSYFMDRQALALAASKLDSGLDCLAPAEVSSHKVFTAVSKKAVERLARVKNLPVTPQTMAANCRTRFPELAVEFIPDLESRGERFLWDLFYAGKRAALPPRVLAGFFDNRPEKDWFSYPAFRGYLKQILGVPGWERLDEWFSQNAIPGGLLGLAAQLRWISGLVEHLPPRRDKFIELGFGALPAGSGLLAGHFRSGLALEPEEFSQDGVRAGFELCRILGEVLPNHPGLGKSFLSGVDPASRVRVEQGFLQDFRLPDHSVDFCFSKTVFEHVMDVEALSAELLRLLRPGGIMLHEIDFSDHQGAGGVHFSFLKHSKPEWRETAASTNLWRINDYAELWRDLGFEVQILYRHDTNLAPNKIHPDWANYNQSDLLCHTAGLKAVRRE